MLSKQPASDLLADFSQFYADFHQGMLEVFDRIKAGELTLNQSPRPTLACDISIEHVDTMPDLACATL